MFKDMLKEVLLAYGPTGRENSVSNVLEEYIRPHCDSVYRDVMGNLIAYKKGVSGKKVMLSAHMDQIGLIVVDIDEKGFLRVSNVGGVSPVITLAREVVFENGVRGVTFYETEKTPASAATLPLMFIDIGASTREEALEKVQIGDIAAYAGNFVDMGKRFACGALDDRLCCAIIIEAVKELKCPHDLYVVFTVQEEVGLRGAGPAAYAIEPDFSLNLDVTRTGDTPKSARMSVSLGEGPTIKVMDSSAIIPQCVRRYMEDCAKEANIPVQNEILTAGGTDAGAILRTRAGILAGCVSIPTRYIHTPVEAADMDDVMNSVKFVRAMLEREALPQA